jgi:hypothetical protein
LGDSDSARATGLNGAQLCGVNGDELIVRLDPDREADALAEPHARAMGDEAAHRPAGEVQMFGGLTFMVSGHMC